MLPPDMLNGLYSQSSMSALSLFHVHALNCVLHSELTSPRHVSPSHVWWLPLPCTAVHAAYLASERISRICMPCSAHSAMAASRLPAVLRKHHSWPCDCSSVMPVGHVMGGGAGGGDGGGGEGEGGGGDGEGGEGGGATYQHMSAYFPLLLPAL